LTIGNSSGTCLRLWGLIDDRQLFRDRRYALRLQPAAQACAQAMLRTPEGWLIYLDVLEGDERDFLEAALVEGGSHIVNGVGQV